MASLIGSRRIDWRQDREDNGTADCREFIRASGVEIYDGTRDHRISVVEADSYLLHAVSIDGKTPLSRTGPRAG